MAVNISRIFRQRWFQQLSSTAKLLYIYLAKNPDLNSVGVICPSMEVAALNLNVSKEDIADAVKELVSKKFIRIKKFDDIYYFIIPAHFNTVPKSESSIRRVNRDLSQLPSKLISFLASINITASNKVREFVKPTAQEVSEYALSHGYIINGNDFIEYYDNQSEKYGKNHWVDGRGTEVKDWKAKLRKIWCKDEDRIPEVDGAPKGFEHYHVTLPNGKFIFPEKWKNGQPWSSSMSSDIILKRQYKNESKKHS